MIDTKWKEIIENEKKKEYYKSLTSFLLKESITHEIYPAEQQRFTSFQLTPFSEVKVVILGQDPYFNPSQAHGLAFSVPHKVALPPSLRNIYKEIENDLGIKMSSTGDLSRWAEQGVFLLNTILTVRAGMPLSHQGVGWEQFTDAVISLLSEDDNPKVFLLWGANAHKKEALITNKRHLILKASHPSPLGYYRSFAGCHHFSLANDFLKRNNRKIIDWQL